MASTCLLCKKRVLSHHKTLKCSVCKLDCHIRCLPHVSTKDELYINRLVTTWFCSVCLDDTLPFHHIVDDNEYGNVILEFSHTCVPVSLSQLDNMIFNPFEVNDEHNMLPIVDIDPDFHYFNSAVNGSIASCNYHFESSFTDEYRKMCSTNKLIFSLMSYNIRSLPRHIDEFKCYLETLGCNFTAIGLCETWLTPANDKLYNIDGYTMLSSVRSHKKGGGVSLLIGNNFNYHTRDDLSEFNDTFESLFIEFNKSVFNSTKNIVVGIMYRPPDTDVEEFNNAFNGILSQSKSEGKLCYILGDFNVNLFNCDKHTPTSNFVDLLYEHNFIPLITKPTRISSHSATLIDNIITNNVFTDNSFQGILYTDMSDHFPLFLIDSSINAEQQTKYYSARNFSDSNKQRFKLTLEQLDWNGVISSNDASDSFSKFHKIITEEFDNCFPYKTTKVGYKTKVPWLTTGLKHSIKRKNMLFHKMKKHNSTENTNIYKRYRNTLNWSLKKAERNYISELLKSNQHNMRKTWGIIKQVINKKRSSSYPDYFTINSKNISDKKQIAQGFNKFFVNIGHELSKSIPDCNISPRSYLSSSNIQSIFLEPVIEEEVVKIISHLKESAAGYDNVCPSIVKTMYTYFVKPLTHVLNLSITKGHFPDELKIAKVIPLFKNGDKKIVSNYRPVSLLSVFSKILERLMYNRLLRFITKHDILYKHQFGFRNKYSTALALTLLTDKISDSFNNENVTIGVFLDFSKAFDTVNHQILLQKLEHYGIRGLAYSWMQSYLTNRSQFVSYNNVCSNTEKIFTGVPQGSVLGPLLFLLYINDMSNVSTKLFSILFADDSNFFISGSNPVDLINTINEELTHVYIWLNANKLSLNVSKSHFMVFTRKKSFDVPSVNICNQDIDRVFSTKFLGVIIDCKMTWKNHIMYIKSKIAKNVGIISRARILLNRSCLKTLYYSFIYPYLTYCIEIWGFTCKTYLEPLIVLQKKVIRKISYEKYNAHTAPLFQDHAILSLPKLILFRLCVFMYKYENKFLPNIFDYMFTRNSDVHRYSTRHSNNFRINKMRCSYFKNTLKYHAIVLYNKSSSIFDYSMKFYKFKKNVKKYLLCNNTDFLMTMF